MADELNCVIEAEKDGQLGEYYVYRTTGGLFAIVSPKDHRHLCSERVRTADDLRAEVHTVYGAVPKKVTPRALLKG